jgi:hypothetical protein
MSDETERTNIFELVASILLGVAAIFTALASFQAGLWDGKMIEGYGKANKIATAAASEQSRAVVEMSKDTQVDLQAYNQILESQNNPALEEKTETLVTYLYSNQLSAPAYKSFGFPPKPVDDPNVPDSEEKIQSFNDDILTKAQNHDLVADENYRQEMLAKSKELNDESEKIFKEGIEANENGDKFELANVIFAISLFFSGISLVMKTNIRWVLLGVGGIFWLIGAVSMAFIPWTFS